MHDLQYQLVSPDTENMSIPFPASLAVDCHIGNGAHEVHWTNSSSSDQSRTPYSSNTLSSPVSIPSTISVMASTIDDSLRYDYLTAPCLEATDSWIAPTPFWHFSASHMEILSRFRERTALTIGDKSIAPKYRECVTQLALSVCLNHFPNPR